MPEPVTAALAEPSACRAGWLARTAAAGTVGVDLSSLTLEVDCRTGVIAILPCVDWTCRRQFWLVHRRDRLLSRAEQAFLHLFPNHPPDRPVAP